MTDQVTQTPEQKKPDCDHKGFWNPVTQTTIDLGDKLLLVLSCNCRQCGHIENTLTPVKLTAGPAMVKSPGVITS